MEHEKISCEYIQEKRQRLETLDNTFGTAVLPTLEKVEYRVSWCNEVLNRVPLSGFPQALEIMENLENH